MAANARATSNRNKKKKGKGKGKKQDNYNDAINNIEEGIDRLSPLPDDILIEILSHLPIRAAITTGVLSHRWRCLWPQITSLNIVDADHQKHIVINVFPQLINVNKLIVDYLPITLVGVYIDSLFDKNLGRNIQEIKVLFVNYFEVCDHSSFIIQILRLPLLKVLELDYHKTYFDIGNGYALPFCMNLKVLKLHFSDNDDNYVLLLDKLLNSCPSLEGLSLKVDYEIGRIKLWGWLIHKPVDSKPMIVDAPKLKYLKMDYCHLSKVFFANNIDTLQKVELYGEFGTLNVDESGRLLNIFEVISKARSLSLGSPSLTMDARMPMFASLVHLKCIVHCSVEDTINLLGFLRKCPMLQVLILNFTPDFFELKKHLERLQCDLAPPSFVTLKRVEMNMRLRLLNGGAFYMVKYLLGSASHLEQLIVNVTGDKNEFTKIAQCEELQICKDIFVLPRKSLLCQVEYFGISLKSTDFKMQLF